MESILSTLPAFAPDAKAAEAARVAIVKAVETDESAYGMWVKAAKAVKLAYPVKANAEAAKADIKGWIYSAFPKAERALIEADVDGLSADDKAKRADVQTKASGYFNRMLQRAYPAPKAEPVVPVLTAAQIIATAATATAKASTLEAAQASVDAEIAKAAAQIKAAEAKAEAARVKAAEAAAKLDTSKLAEAEAAKVKAEAAAKTAAEAKAEADEADKAKAEKVAAAKAAQADATAKVEAIQTEKKVKAVITETEALLLSAGGLAAPGIVDFATAVRNALATFKTLNI
jgi:hypothetical protein